MNFKKRQLEAIRDKPFWVYVPEEVMKALIEYPSQQLRRWVTKQRKLGSELTGPELAQTWANKCLECCDCASHPWSHGEDFYVHDRLWLAVMPKYKRGKIICVACFEKRLGRPLRRSDFKPWFLRNGGSYSDGSRLHVSPLLRSRLQ